MPYTFYEQVLGELTSPPSSPEFPDVMEAFAVRYGRASLLRLLRERFNYIRSFSEIYGQATRFHDCLSTMYPIVDLVTTNWDTGFEDRCGATAIVTPTDYAFWDEPSRKVFKLHGSITSWGSIVATRKDYDRAAEDLRNKVIGGSLRHLLATKRVLFAGYSLRDPDFQEIYGMLKEQMGDVLPRSYVVTLDPDISEESVGTGATIIRTDGEYLLSRMKERMVDEGVMLCDDIFEAAAMASIRAAREHRRLEMMNFQEHPMAIYSMVYQDGLKHALDRALTLRKTGEYSHSCNVVNARNTYERKQKEARRQKSYGDVAYLEGYLNGLAYLLIDDEERDLLPFYYLPGCPSDLISNEEFLAALPDAAGLHKAAHALARRQIRGFDASIVFHHPPFL